MFADYLEFPVTEQDINDLMGECDKNNTGSILKKDFIKMFNS